MSSSDRPGAGVWRTTLTASSALTTTALPVFLVGVSSDAIRRDLGIDETAIGAAITVMFVAAALGAAPAGWLSERVGGARAVRAGVLVSGSATAAIGLFAQQWWHLAVGLAVIGATIGLIDTGAARAFSERVPPSGQGTAFGVKEASIPAASLLAGLSLPTVAGQLGWRGVFLATLLLAVAVWAVLPRPIDGSPWILTLGSRAARDGRSPEDPPVGAGAPRAAGGALVRFAVGAGLGTGAATAAATFLVPSSTAGGLEASTAGLVLAVGSVTSIAVRLGGGRWADDPSRHAARAVSWMLLIGAVGAAVLAASAGSTFVTIVGTLLLLGGGWGWTGLAFLAAVRSRPDAPAVAAGVVLSGLAAGGALGPLAFGALAAGVSYTAAWVLAAVALALAAVTTATARRGPAASASA